MTGARETVPQSLALVRRRLTTWYAVTFMVILCVLGVGMFASITQRFDEELDVSLRQDAEHLGRFAGQPATIALLANERSPERSLALMDSLGRHVAGHPVDPWVAELARRAWREHSSSSLSQVIPGDRIMRAVAWPVSSAHSPAVAVAVADEVELEDQYQSLIAAFIAAGIAAVFLVAIGGWFVAGQAMIPVADAFQHMRRFMADAAHELRTPVSVVRTRAGVALQQERNVGEYVAALTGIERESERLTALVDDLLTLARADAGERQIIARGIFLDDVMLDAVDTARVLAFQKSIQLEVTSFEECAVQGDPDLLRQLILILLDNGIKYTASGGMVSVGASADAESVTLTVTDSGVGIPAQHLPHIFERFYRGDTARTRATDVSMSQGAGLGLAIAQWIVTAHAGVIRVRSEVDAGTTVTVTLPKSVSRP